MEINKRPKTIFVHGRPAGHPLHAKYGRAVADEFTVEDPWFRWHDKNYPSFVRYMAWLVNAFFFVSFRKRIVLTECFRITLVLAKILSLNRITILMLVDDESPYFIHSRFYTGVSLVVNRWGYNQYDGFICIGKMETWLVKQVLNQDNNRPICTSVNGVSSERASKLKRVPYIADSKKIVFIGHGPGTWRSWYKGLDILFSAFAIIAKTDPYVTLEIVGEWDETVISQYMTDASVNSRIKFHGRVNSIDGILKDAALYLHLGRGEAWGIAVNEAMTAGVVPIVSEWTGAKECVEQVSVHLVVPLDVDVVAERVKWFLKLPATDKIALSEKCRLIAERYTEQSAVEQFTDCFKKIVSKIN